MKSSNKGEQDHTKALVALSAFFEKWGRYLLALFTLIIFLSTPLYEKYSERYIDNSLKSTAILYATLRGLNGAVSVVKQSSLTVGVGVEGNLALGEVLDPIDDAIERFSTLVTTSLWIFGAEKALFEISKTEVVIAMAILLAIAYIFFPSQSLKKILLVLIALRLFIPVSGLVAHYSDKTVFDPPIKKELEFLAATSRHTTAVQEHSTQKQNFWSKVSGTLDKTAQQMKKVQQTSLFYIQNMDKIVASLINLALAYVGKTFFHLIFMPLLFFYIIKQKIV